MKNTLLDVKSIFVNIEIGVKSIKELNTYSTQLIRYQKKKIDLQSLKKSINFLIYMVENGLGLFHIKRKRKSIMFKIHTKEINYGSHYKQLILHNTDIENGLKSVMFTKKNSPVLICEEETKVCGAEKKQQCEKNMRRRRRRNK